MLDVYKGIFLNRLVVVFTITWTASWLHKRRRRQPKETDSDRIQRAKNYLLEDYLEENKLLMHELANIEKNEEIQESIELLKSVGYDYDRFKAEKRKLL